MKDFSILISRWKTFQDERLLLFKMKDCSSNLKIKDLILETWIFPIWVICLISLSWIFPYGIYLYVLSILYLWTYTISHTGSDLAIRIINSIFVDVLISLGDLTYVEWSLLFLWKCKFLGVIIPQEPKIFETFS